MTDERFEDYICKKNDVTNDLAYKLMIAFSKPGEKLERNQYHIGAIMDAVEAVMTHHGLKPCYPFWTDSEEEEDGVPCYRSEERCNYCPFKIETEESENA